MRIAAYKSGLGAAITAALLLAGCGSREPLQLAPGKTMPVAPQTARTQPTTEDLLTTTAEARPERTDEPLRRSQEREDDRFDLPPT